MPPVDPGDALRNIADYLPGIREELKGLREGERKNRKMIRWLVAACVILTPVALAAIGWTAYQQTVINSKSATIARLADQNAANAVRDARDLCLSGNVARAASVEPWNFVLSIVPPARTAADRRERGRFKAHLALITAPRDCAHLNPHHP